MNITDISSISYDEIRNYLENYIQSLPEYAQKWKEFYEGGAGQTVLNVASGVTAFLAFSAYLNRKNSLLDYGVLPSSIVEIAVANGFIYNRSCCPRLRITFTTNVESFYKKEIIIGNYKSFNLSLLEDTHIVKGENTIDVAIGEWDSTILTISDTTEYYGFMIESDIDNNYYELFLNDKILPTTLYPENLDKTNVLIRSYRNGIYIISGNDLLGKKLNPSDKIKINYIIPSKKLSNAVIDIKDIQLLFSDFVIKKIDTIDYGSDPDSDNKLVALSPGYKLTHRILMSLGDFKYLGGAYQGLISANAKPNGNICCNVDVTYLRQDENLFTDQQKNEFLQYLKDHSILGMSINLIDPKVCKVNIRLKILLESSSVSTSDIQDKIKEIYERMCFNLGGIFSPGSILANSISGVSRIYLVNPIADRQAEWNEYFRLDSLFIEFETNELKLLQSGTDLQSGYS